MLRLWWVNGGFTYQPMYTLGKSVSQAGSGHCWDQRICWPVRLDCSLGYGFGTCGTRVENDKPKDFLGLRHSLPSQVFLSFTHPESAYCEEHVHTHTHTHNLTAYRLYMNYRCYQITLQYNIFTQIRSGVKCRLDIYRWGAGLAVAGRIRDVEQKVLESSFHTGSSSSPQLLPRFVTYRIPRGGFY